MEQYSPINKKIGKKVLIIGGGGFVARRLIERLKRASVRIAVLSRHRTENITPDIEFISGDFSDESIVKRCVSDAHIVYHIANPIGRNWREYMCNTVLPTRKLAILAADAGVEQFFYTSSIDLYNSSQAHLYITGETPSDPNIFRRNHYARAKAECEAGLRKIDNLTKMRVTIFRLGITIGKGAPHAHRGIGHFNSPSQVFFWGTGTNRLPFVLVDDVAEAFVLAMGNPVVAGQTLLICAPPSLTAKEYMEAVASRSQQRISARPFPIWLFWAGEAVKEAIKHIMRHPNRRVASLHDWKCRAHLANYDPSTTMQMLGWNPTSDKRQMIAQGVHSEVDDRINAIPSKNNHRIFGLLSVATFADSVAVILMGVVA